MTAVLLAVAVAIVVAVVVVAMGRGGELAHFASDARQWDPEIESAADVALLRPPTSLLGYNAQATDDALGKIARVVTTRDVEIASLRQRIAELENQGPPPAARRGPPGPVPPAGPAGPPATPTRPWSAWERSSGPDPGLPGGRSVEDLR